MKLSPPLPFVVRTVLLEPPVILKLLTEPKLTLAVFTKLTVADVLFTVSPPKQTINYLSC